MQKFGEIAYLLDKRSKSKLSPKSKKCVFVGYCTDANAYWLYDVKNQTLIKSRDVVFTNLFGHDYKFEEFIEPQIDVNIEPVADNQSENDQDGIESIQPEDPESDDNEPDNG